MLENWANRRHPLNNISTQNMSGLPSAFNSSVVHESLEPISWLIGRWRTEDAKGYFPTIKPFTYCEEIEFISIGQPILNYQSFTWHPENLNPMHAEAGFLRIKPGTNDVAFMVALNFGLSVVEEGKVDGLQLSLLSTGITRMSFAKGSSVVKTHRSISLEDGELKQVISMETGDQPMTEHLTAIYVKVK